ncbi:glycosyltransferase [Nonomuraea sp. NPDC049646]|uniref:glycosyltransferase n=1 Tax=unclassified Nonomuraea TaxID=2593643 RepID=UPI0037B98869
MRVLVLIPVYRLDAPTGAVITTREYLRHLARSGHVVDVVTTIKEPGEVRVEDGVRVWPLRAWRRAVQAARPELLISHHGDRRAARIVPQAGRVPHLLMVHGMAADRELGRARLAWFPSRACRDHYPSYQGPDLVLPPPIDPALYRTLPGGMITLNGATVAKGADVLAEIAAQLPDLPFLVVKAAGPAVGLQLPNIAVIDRIDPRELYTRTRILLMPSATESYGRAGIEAMLSGIPVLASPLPGMREAFGNAATYIPREHVGRWVSEIRHLSNSDAYAAASATARAHAAGLDYGGNLRRFEEACQRLVPRTMRARGPRRAPAALPLSAPAGPAPAPTLASQVADRAVGVVAWVHYGVPYRRAGSETMLHTMMRALHQAGLRTLVIVSEVPEAPARYQVDGVGYAQLPPEQAVAEIRAISPHVVITHHYYGHQAVTLARQVGARSILILHNDHDQPALAAGPDLCVYNTVWVRDSLGLRYPAVGGTPSLIVHPPVLPKEHAAARTGRHVTLVNLNRDKGVDTWRAAARLVREVPFLGVTGAHGRQIRRPLLANMRIIGQTSRMREEVWARSRIVLAPSIYESYGMAAVEALASGLPVIAHPTPGLREALGDAATFIDRADPSAWAAAIRDLYPDGRHRAAACSAARARSRFLAKQVRAELAAWVDAVTVLCRS